MSGGKPSLGSTKTGSTTATARNAATTKATRIVFTSSSRSRSCGEASAAAIVERYGGPLPTPSVASALIVFAIPVFSLSVCAVNVLVIRLLPVMVGTPNVFTVGVHAVSMLALGVPAVIGVVVLGVVGRNAIAPITSHSSRTL